MAIVRIGWSGGKDSTCATYKRLENGDTVKALCYVPYFTKDIPLINKEHHEFILRQADIFRAQGAAVFFAEGITFWDYCLSICKSGINAGQVKGYPYVNACGFRRDSKIAACDNTDVGYYDFQDIGIAYDEFARHGQLSESKRSILVEQKITELMAARFCIERDALSPHYQYSKRDGCALCVNAKPIERAIWFNDYPAARGEVIRLQEMLKPLLVGRKNEFPLRGYQYFVDTDQLQLSFFD